MLLTDYRKIGDSYWLCIGISVTANAVIQKLYQSPLLTVYRRRLGIVTDCIHRTIENAGTQQFNPHIITTLTKTNKCNQLHCGTHTHTYSYTHTHNYAHMHMCMHTHTHTHTHTQACMHAHTHTCMCAHPHPHTCMHTCTSTCTHTRTRTHTHTHSLHYGINVCYLWWCTSQNFTWWQRLRLWCYHWVGWWQGLLCALC